MLKRILKNKSFLLSILTFCFSLLVFATVGYAWISISNSASVDSFVGTMENHEIDYNFSEVIDGSITEVNGIKTNDVIPGQSNTFILTLTNAGSHDNLVDIFFTNIFSEINTGTEFVKEYENRYQKVQYAYSFTVNLVAYIPGDANIVGSSDPAHVKVPDANQVVANGWIEQQRNTELNYFNKVDAQGNDIKDYTMLSQIPLNHKLTDKDTADKKSSLIIYFTIKFNSTPDLTTIPETPGVVIPDESTFNGEYYANQRFNISHITIQGLD